MHVLSSHQEFSHYFYLVRRIIRSSSTKQVFTLCKQLQSPDQIIIMRKTTIGQSNKKSNSVFKQAR